MAFSNTDIFPEQLPRIAQSKQHLLSSKHRLANIAVWLLFMIVGAVLLSICRFQPVFPLPNHLAALYLPVLIIWCSFCGLFMVYHFFADPLKRYTIRELDVGYSSGLVFRKAIHQPMLRIQHIELKRGPVERILGLATLQVFGAGGVMHTFQIPGLEADIAAQMRQFILDHKDLKQHG